MSGEHFADETGFDAALAALEDEPVEHGVTAVYPSAASRVAADDLTGALAYGFARRLRWLAIQRQAPAEAVRKLARAAAEASRATADGHVCIELAGLAERSGEALGVWREQLLASGLVGRDASRPLVLDAHDRLYLARYYDYERRLARALGVLAAAREPLGAAALRERLEAFPGEPVAGEVDWQRVAAALSLDRRLTIISGGPGTGKTSTVVGILACLLTAHPGLRIALAAPTGKAAQRMQEALLARAGSLPASLAERLPARASTLHRLLGAGSGGQFRYRRGRPLPYDAVVVDEASMIDVAMGARLLDAIAPHARLILLGDKDQLAAVEAGAVFAELSARPVLSAARLDVLAEALGVPAGTLRDAWPGVVQGGDGPTRVAEAVPAQEDEKPPAAAGGSRSESGARQLSLFDAPWVPETPGERLPEGVPGTLPKRLPEGVPETLPERLSEGVPETLPERLSEGVPETLPERLSEDIPETRPKRFSEAFPERFFEAFPKTVSEPGTLPGTREPAGPSPARAPLADCVVWLEKNYRFGLDSSIGRLSLAIRAGDTRTALAELSNDEGAAARLIDDAEPQLAAALVTHLGQGFAGYASALARLAAFGPGLPMLSASSAASTTSTGSVSAAPASMTSMSSAASSASTSTQVLPGWFTAPAVSSATPEQPSLLLTALFEALNRFRVLCAVRGGPRGVERLNALLSIQLRELLGIATPAAGKAAAGTSWFAGRPVMVTRNDYALGLFNGDIGIALPGGDGALRVVFPSADGAGWRAISPAALPPHETALALTVHKSQGSEFDRAVLILPAQANRTLTRELVYTAVTRARHAVEIVGSRAVLSEAIATPTRRASGLALRLAEADANGG